VDLYATLASPIEAVFGYLADPAHLGDWLREVAGAAADPKSPAGVGASFPVTVHLDAADVAATGEMTAFEPPWLVGYRLFIGAQAHGLRVTCTVQAADTRIHVHQPDDATPLTVDIPRLSHCLAAARPAAPPAVRPGSPPASDSSRQTRRKDGP
jgi:hypothetical protein